MKNPHPQLEQIVAAYLESLDAGQPLDRGQLLTQHPELTEELASFFSDYDEMAILSDGFADVPPSTNRNSPRTHRTPAGSPQGELADDPPDHRPGRVFGDYELLEEIARGGMGIVYKARQISLGRIVALKMIIGGQFAAQDDLARFHAEAVAAANLDHPGIIPIYEVGQQGDTPYFSMGFLEGGTLADRVREGPLSAVEAVANTRQVAEAVCYAHQQGVIHRDLKPGNILLDRDGHPKVTDFGLAKRVEADSALTATGQVVGTPAYMSPEQAGGRTDLISESTDIYSLGALLYCLLTGRPPFQADTPVHTLAQVVGREPVPLRTLNPQIPVDLETICLKCLSKDPAGRYPTAAELVAELRRFERGEPILARPVGRIARTWRWCLRNRITAGLLAAIGLLLLIGCTTSTLLAVVAIRERNKASRSYSYADAQRKRADRKAAEAEQRAAREAQAKQDALERLRQSYLAEAHGLQWSGTSGQRATALIALGKAAQIRPGIDLRNQAIASMALVDLVPRKQWKAMPLDSESVGFDRPLRRYARGDQQGNVSVRNIEDDSEITRLPGFGVSTGWEILEFSNSGRYLAVGYRRAACWIWDLQRAEPVLKIPAGPFEAGFDFSPDDRQVALAEANGRVRVFTIESGELVTEFQVPPTGSHVQFCPRGVQLAVCSRESGRVQIHAADSGKLIRRFQHHHHVHRVAWHPDPDVNRIAVNCQSTGIVVWDVATGATVQTCRVHAVTDTIHYHPRGDLLIAGGWDGLMHVWDAHTGRQLLATRGSPRAFTADGKRLVGNASATDAIIWDFSYDDACRRLELVSDGINAARFHPTQPILAAAGKHGLFFIDFLTGRTLAHAAVGDTRSVDFSADGRLIYTSGSGGLLRLPVQITRDQQEHRWQVGPPQQLWQLGEVREGALSADNRRLAACSVWGTGVVLDLETERQVLMKPQREMSFLDVSPDGAYVATGAWRSLSGTAVWDAETGKRVHLFPHAFNFSRPRFSPDGKSLIIGTTKAYQFWEVGSWKLQSEIPRDDVMNLFGALSFSPDGRYLALNNTRHDVQLRNAGNHDLLAAFTISLQSVRCFSPDGNHLIVIEYQDGRERLRAWDLRLVRQQLRSLGLDWDAQPLPEPRDDAGDLTGPVTITIAAGS